MDLDLHIHSTASDGAVDPAGVVRAALDASLDVIALTDHDTVAGIEGAVAAAREQAGAAAGYVEVIPALEVSSTWEGEEVHILGYFVDPDHPEVAGHETKATERRAQRLREMVARLGAQGVRVSFDAVLESAGAEVASLGRPHLARALQAAGYVESVPEAFDRYIGDEHPAYIPTQLLDPAGAIELIHEAGGLAVWAHPPMRLLDVLLPRLVGMRLDGLEVHRPRNGPERVRALLARAEGAGLVVTGGSDWHGPDDGELGEFRVAAEDVAAFLERGGL